MPDMERAEGSRLPCGNADVTAAMSALCMDICFKAEEEKVVDVSALQQNKCGGKDLEN